jgi:nucleotide-binding universal stress UspA family protein
MSVASTNRLPAVWDRVVCGIDGTAASLNAARQVAALMPAAGQLMLCVVVEAAQAQARGMSKQSLVSAAEDALAQVRGEISGDHDTGVHLREGAPTRVLLHECNAERATLLAIGSHGGGLARPSAVSVAAGVFRKASCSVLIAHGSDRAGAPAEGGIVVGFDGSDGARDALSVARELAARLSLSLRVLVATGDGDRLDPGWLDNGLGSGLAVSEDPRPALDALLDASATAGLLILGRSSRRGVPVLPPAAQSIAERASCPVLIVR